jgi:ATP-binding cassette subfamily F protein uup
VPAPPPATAPAPAAADRPRRLSYKDQRELEGLPARIEALESEQAQLQAQVADPGLFRSDPEGAARALGRLQALDAELHAAYARWDLLETVRP